MSEDPGNTQPPDEGLQFDHAEYAEEQAAGLQCAACQQPIVAEYYEINGKVTCELCREKIQAALTGGSRMRRFVRATIFGAIAAGIGSLIYYAVSYLTGYEFALVAIVVGLLVGGGVRFGSDRRGGWFYQLLAIFLTYTAIVTTYIPRILAEFRDLGETEQQTTSAPAAPAAASRPQGPVAASAPADPASIGKAKDRAPASGLENASTGYKIFIVLAALVILLILAYAVPILATFSGGGFIGLIIIGVALYEAWRMNKRLHIQITGPYQLAPENVAEPESDQYGV